MRRKSLCSIASIQIAKRFLLTRKKTVTLCITFCFDLPQVQPQPLNANGRCTLCSSNLLVCPLLRSSDVVHLNFYECTEDLAGRGASQIDSTLLHYLQNLNVEEVNLIRLFCDGCAGENKNYHIIHTLMCWLKSQSPENVTEKSITFPVRRHSFLPSDKASGHNI